MSTLICALYFLSMRASARRAMLCIIQLAVYMRDLKSTRFSFTIPLWPANSPNLNLIENLWDHRDRVVRSKDSYSRNLVQLATALEPTWFNIPVNTFRNLIDCFLARLAAVRSAKGG
ncbi:uncharacterized protein TNCV_4108871 [Trichonephila clavipes]|nr:uncharacterized protein TNCV_4108871 [Trichonephila clavipes]